MWDYTLYEFECPYCGHKYERTVGAGNTYKYKNSLYDLYTCPSCKKEFLGKYHSGVFIKMPENKCELKSYGAWIS